ncbi:squalene--hopene cyclase [Paenibacillus sp. sptzw28]|nr:prenyltransferase/squalene oxidase repeat-containing protein [Paenibacillus sp. sptzw28]QYR23746.1 squalene--hopene cyclase [Paenibacillus sp. sptzw28]
MLERVNSGIGELVDRLLNIQSRDGSWRLGFIESGMMSDAATIMLITTLGLSKGKLISSLAERILAGQRDDGAWRVYPDEPYANISASLECYFALLHAGIHASEPFMAEARSAIEELGGLSRIDSLMTKFLLAVIGQYPWPKWFPVPLSIMMLPRSSPLHFYQFSGYARVHMAPMLLLGHRKPVFKPPSVSPLPGLRMLQLPAGSELFDWDKHFSVRKHPDDYNWFKQMKQSLNSVNIQRQAARRAEQYMLSRLEADGTLYSYSSSTILMVHALRSIGYRRDHPVIARAIQGLESFLWPDHGRLTMQNATSTVWDTALISHSLQQAGLSPLHPSIKHAGRFLLSRQHTKTADWQLNVKHPIPGGWGFSNINTINPDVDDTTASLRAINKLGAAADYRKASNLGLQWLLAMQNKDGGWAAFERNIDNPLISWLPLDGAADAATDPSSADLTGRTLEYLGRTAGLSNEHRFIRNAVNWLYKHQESDGSWYGRWGVCYIYGTWAALTGLAAVGEPPDHPKIRKAADWLLAVQNSDGGFGESCGSDRVKRFIPLSSSTLSQTAWALDALTAVNDEPLEPVKRSADFILRSLRSDGLASSYPTGAGLPGHFYTRYESYPLVWPLLALSNYRLKYNAKA